MYNGITHIELSSWDLTKPYVYNWPDTEHTDCHNVTWTTGMSNLPFSSHCQAHFDSVSVQHVRDILELIHSKDFFENLEFRNINVFIKDTNFYRRI